MSVTLYEIFPTPIWHIKEELPRGAYDWALEIQKNNKSVRRSNVGGYQSNATVDWTTMVYKQHILKCLNVLPRFQLSNWWVNINKKGDFNDYHTHPESMLSAVWYITDNFGSIEFQNPLDHDRNKILNDMGWSTNNTFNCTAGDILVFPSDLVHRVLPHTEDNLRISVSFNTNPNIPDGYKLIRIPERERRGIYD